MTDDLVKRLREAANLDLYGVHRDVERAAADRIEVLEQALLDIFDYECRTSSKSLIACAARDTLWPSEVKK
jgi:hypothetical protein